MNPTQLAQAPAAETPATPAATPAPAAVVRAEPEKIHLLREWTHNRHLLAARIDPKTRFIVSGAHSNLVQRWNWETGQKIELTGHDSWVRAFAFSLDGETLISGGNDGRLIWWPITADAPQPIRTVEAHAGWIRALALSPDGNTLASCGNDNLIKFWNVADGAPIRTLAGHASHVYNVAYHPAGGHVVSCDLKGVGKLWDLATGSELRQYNASALYGFDKAFVADIGGARGMAFSSDAKHFVFAGVTEVSNAFAGIGQPAILRFDWEQPEPLQKFKLKDAFNGFGRGVVYHRDGFIIGAFGGHDGGTLAFFKPESPQEYFRFKLPSTVYDLAISADGLSLAVAHFDGYLRLYRMTAPVPAEAPAAAAG